MFNRSGSFSKGNQSQDHTTPPHRGYARGTNPHQKYIHGRLNLNWVGYERAQDEEIIKSDFASIAADFSEITDSAAAAYEAGDMENYYHLRETAAKVYAAHRTWDHFKSSYPERIEDLHLWQEEYQKFRAAASLNGVHENVPITQMYQNMGYYGEDMTSAIDGITYALHQNEKMTKAKAAYKDRVQDGKPRPPHDEHREQNTSEQQYPFETPEFDEQECEDIEKFYSILTQGENKFQERTSFSVGDDPNTNKVMTYMVSLGLFDKVGDNHYSYTADKEALFNAKVDVGNIKSKAKEYSSGVKFYPYDDDDLTSIQILNKYIKDGTIREKDGKMMMTVPDVGDGNAEYVYRALAEDGIMTYHGVTSNGRHLYEMNVSKEEFNNLSESVDHEMGYRGKRRREQHENTHPRSETHPETEDFAAQSESPSKPRPQAGSGGGGNKKPPRPDNGKQESADPNGESQKKPKQDQKKKKKFTDSDGKEHPVLQRASKRIENNLGVAGFGSTRMTGRKRIGPFVINTGLSGFMGVSSISLNIGPVMWSLWSKEYESGLSSVDLPGMFSFRGKRKKKSSRVVND